MEKREEYVERVTERQLLPQEGVLQRKMNPKVPQQIRFKGYFKVELKKLT